MVDVISHELAHMWFGDLVTMRWWNGIWLNEAFATFMEMLATDAFRPAWDRWVAFGAARPPPSTSTRSTPPGRSSTRCSSPADAEGMFDVLTYEKGAATVRMLERHLGADDFRRGISAYLAEHAYDEHRDQRPVGRARGRLGATGPTDHGQLDLPGRLSGRSRPRSTGTRWS